MTRRSTKLMRLENSLYIYDNKNESWQIKNINQNNDDETIDFFDLGSYFTCKHMSQKVNPISFRINNNKTWDSAWYSNYKYFGVETGKLQLDIYIREYIQGVFRQLKILIDKIYIKEINDKYLIKIFIFEKGLPLKKDILINSKRVSRYKSYIIDSKKDLINPFFKTKSLNSKNWYINPKKTLNHIETQLNYYFNKDIHISMVYRKDIGSSASLLGKFLTSELEKPNMNFKKALKDSLNQIRNKDNIRGLRVNCSGRLGRAPMAKMEWFRFGSIPLTKISAKVDYVQLTGKTKYGSFGIKVWLYKH
jgi:ribosomal protein S3